MGTDLEVWDGDDEVIEGEEVERPLVERQAEVAQEIARASADLARLSEEAAAIPHEQEATGTALVSRSTTPKAAKTRLARLRANAENKREEIKVAQKEIETLMRKQMELAREALAPLQKFVARLEEGIWMVNLYLGRDEEILVLKGEEFEPAPAAEPVVIRQLVLAMDEECAINPEDEGIDSTNIGEFDKWLLANPAHVDQVIPNAKGVVALRPRFRSKNYADPWKAQAIEEADRKTYFLIRNGDRLYRTYTDFNAGERLVPTQDEFSSFFFEEPRGGLGISFSQRKRKHRIPITPGTPAWERAEEAADERQRHYMRVALILQGLVDRTTVFRPLPEGGISFVDHEQGGKTWKFVSDAEKLLTTGRKPFKEWLVEKNAELRQGMRIIGAFDGWDTGFGVHRYEQGQGHHRISPKHAPYPTTGVLHIIEDEKPDGGLVFRYKRTDRIWGWSDSHEPKRRASCVVYRDDRFIIPFDLVTIEEMREYLNARLERHAYSEMFPILLAAIQAKIDEAAEEQPFRTMLAGVLARDNGVDLADAVEAVPDLVEWFKLTNKNHRPLVGTEEDQSKAVRMIVTEHALRLKAKQAAAPVVEKIRAAYPQAILVARKRSGRYAALVPENDDNVFVREYEFSAKGVQITYGAWKLISPARVARWSVAHRTERYEAWNFNTSLREHLTGPEFDGFVERLTENAKEEKLVALAYHSEKRRFYLWRYKGDAVIDDARPLTGEHKKVEVEEKQVSWRRVGRDAVLGREDYSRRSKYVYQRKPWDSRPNPGESAGWWDDKQVSDEEMEENRYVVAYHDPKLDERVEAERERYVAIQKRDSKMSEQVRHALGSIEEAWLKREEEREYAKFLEEYADPELWEGHRKLLTIGYPHRHQSGGFHSASDVFFQMLRFLVEQGIDFDGLTVAEAIDRSKEHNFLIDPDARYVPDDLLDLRFDLSKDAEDDEEDEDADG